MLDDLVIGALFSLKNHLDDEEQVGWLICFDCDVAVLVLVFLIVLFVGPHPVIIAFLGHT